MRADTSSVPGPSRHQREGAGAVDGGGVAPRLRAGEGDGGGGDGDLAAVAPAPGEAPTTADRIEATEELIARLEGDLAEAAAAGEAAGETRARVALAAAEGDPAARAELEAATVAATRAVLGGQNVELALVGARARLAELKAQAERERLARERLEALAVCDRRAQAARAVDEALRALAAALRDWTDTRKELAAYASRGQGWLDCNLDASRAVPAAMLAVGSYEFPRMMGVRTGHVAPEEVLPVAEGDWVLKLARRERGEEVDMTNPRLRRYYPPAVPAPARADLGPCSRPTTGRCAGWPRGSGCPPARSTTTSRPSGLPATTASTRTSWPR